MIGHGGLGRVLAGASLAAAVLTLAGCNAPEPSPTTEASEPAPAPLASEAPPASPSAPAAAASTEPSSTADPEDDASDAATERKVASLRPLDECARLPGWAAFHGKLTDAVSRRDAKALVALAAPDVTLDYGGGHGRDELAKRLATPQAGTALWTDLATILRMGCDTRDGLAVMPWFFWNVPETIDPGETMLATGSAIPLLAKPKADAARVASLDWEVVTLQPGFDPARRFTGVETEDGLKGQVETKNLRSVLARRMIVERNDGTWQVSAFVAGD
ncbi:hypothetical protein [Novosphingobium olei]|uniref:hypothetical protein n=1 Tax=Novosphingobium olei TaxID=2728851 RepID=UPI00308CFE42|nr:hypothetical protein NSDW_07410 [Novosphingobium olei]